MALSDIDGDGDPDAFVSNSNGKSNKLWINDGTGKFAEHSQGLGTSNSMGLALGDVDGDGDLDAFVANMSPNTVWLNQSPVPEITISGGGGVSPGCFITTALENLDPLFRKISSLF